MFDKLTEDHYNWLPTIKKLPDMLEKCFGLSFMDSDKFPETRSGYPSEDDEFSLPPVMTSLLANIYSESLAENQR